LTLTYDFEKPCRTLKHCFERSSSRSHEMLRKIVDRDWHAFASGTAQATRFGAAEVLEATP